MNRKQLASAVACLAALAIPATAVQVPAGTELYIRLTDKVATEAKTQPGAVHAVLIAPAVVNGALVISAGTQVTGEVKQVKAAAAKEPATLQLVFTELSDRALRAKVLAPVSAVDNARETVDKTGLITGIIPNETFSSRIDQGIAKLQANQKYSALAGIIATTKEALNIQESNPNIDYEPGTEMTLTLSEPVEWKGTDHGASSRLRPLPSSAQSDLTALVNRQPFRTVTDISDRPSDMTNLMFVATPDELVKAFEQAGWHAPSRLGTESRLETARALIESRGYKEGPMSVLLLDGSPPSLAFEKGNNTFAQRHHLRIFRRPGVYAGKPIWVCSATHDIGIDYSDRDRTFIHRIDPDIDAERAKVVNDLLYTGAVQSLALVPRTNLPQNAYNATGDPLNTDGAMAVLIFQ